MVDINNAINWGVLNPQTAPAIKSFQPGQQSQGSGMPQGSQGSPGGSMSPGILASQPQAGQSSGMPGGNMMAQAGIASATPKAQPAPNPIQNGGGGDSGGMGGIGSILGLLGGGGGGSGGGGSQSLSQMMGFGSNPVAQANQALSKQMSAMPTQDVANMVSPSSVVQQQKIQQMQQSGQYTQNQLPNIITNQGSVNQIQGIQNPATILGGRNYAQPNNVQLPPPDSENVNSPGHSLTYDKTPGPLFTQAANSSGTSLQSPNASQIRGGGPLSIANMQQMAAKQFPGDPVRQQLAVSQAAEESGLMSGKPSNLASQQNNLFGMTGTGNAGSVTKTGNLDTHPQQFAAYNSPQDSFAAYAKTLQNPRYASAMNATDFTGAAQGMKNGGYATDPKYVDNLQNVHDKIYQNNAIKQATNMAAVPGATPANVAASYMGLGRQNHPEALQGFFKKSLGQYVNIQNTPWCAAYANSVLQATGHGHAQNVMQAKSLLNYGTPTNAPSKGDVVVFNDLTGRNDPAHGHAGFFNGFTQNGKMVSTLGGNEDGKVEIKEYPASMVAGYRVPPTAGELQQKVNNPQGAQLASNAAPQNSAGLLQNTQQNPQAMSQQPGGASQQKGMGQQTQGQQLGSKVTPALSRNLMQEQKSKTKVPGGTRNMNEINWGLLG